MNIIHSLSSSSRVHSTNLPPENFPRNPEPRILENLAGQNKHNVRRGWEQCKRWSVKRQWCPAQITSLGWHTQTPDYEAWADCSLCHSSLESSSQLTKVVYPLNYAHTPFWGQQSTADGYLLCHLRGKPFCLIVGQLCRTTYVPEIPQVPVDQTMIRLCQDHILSLSCFPFPYHISLFLCLSPNPCLRLFLHSSS